MRRMTVLSGFAYVGAWLTKEEALFLLGLCITVLQIIYDYYKSKDPIRNKVRL